MRLLNLSADSGHSRSTIVANATAATTIVTHALLMVAAAWCSVLLNPGTLREYTAATTMNQENHTYPTLLETAWGPSTKRGPINRIYSSLPHVLLRYDITYCILV